MTLFVVFLRGINVGGRSVRKETLQEVFTSLGFQNVVTYKQSGNVIFEADSGNVEDLKKKIETKFQETLGYKVAVFVRTIAQLKDTIRGELFMGQKIENTSFLVTFLTSAVSKFPIELPAVIPKSTAKVILFKNTEVFSETHGGGEGALPNPFIESKLKVKATTRNINIIREIVEKFSS